MLPRTEPASTELDTDVDQVVAADVDQDGFTLGRGVTQDAPPSVLKQGPHRVAHTAQLGLAIMAATLQQSSDDGIGPVRGWPQTGQQQVWRVQVEQPAVGPDVGRPAVRGD